jgi:hypothetical protein
MTEPSAEASLPTPITVQLWGMFSAADKNLAARIVAAIKASPPAKILSPKREIFMVFSSAFSGMIAYSGRPRSGGI